GGADEHRLCILVGRVAALLPQHQQACGAHDRYGREAVHMSGGLIPNLHDLSIGDDFPTMVNVIIEIPPGVQTKYEYNPQLGVFTLDRVLHAAVHYPAAYGFIPQTRWRDGDPLDILVVIHEPLFPGCLVRAKPLALLQMQDEKG